MVNYRCGECNAQVPLSAADAVRCKECGHRVLYKERTKRYVLVLIFLTGRWEGCGGEGEK